MSISPKVKICGLTRPEDAQLALQAGAHYFGMIFYPGSPRCVSAGQAKEILSLIPSDRSVGVTVMPSLEDLAELKTLGFAHFQVHFDSGIDLATIAGWADSVGLERLWLAPRLRPGTELPSDILKQANTFLIDTYSEQHYGGSGETGDWEGFCQLQGLYPEKKWILAGGLNPDNIAKALDVCPMRFIDVNSGVESAPGIKDPDKIRALFDVL